MSKNVLIVKGGFSDEAEISRKSACSVEKALKLKGHKTMLIEPSQDFISFLLRNKNNIDVIFNSLHGSWGEDGKIQGIFEYLKIPYTHSGVTSSALGMNKVFSKSIFIQNNIASPKGKIISKNILLNDEHIKRPFIIKPVDEGSSFGVHLVKKDTNLNSLIIKDNLKKYLLEEYIPGTDITVAIMNGKAIGFIEVTTKNEIYGYDDKYNSTETKYLQPENLDKNIENLLLANAEKSFDLLDCKGIARVDFRFNKEDKNNKLYMLEINTQPGLTDTSLFPKIAINAGIDFPDLIEWIVKDAGVNR